MDLKVVLTMPSGDPRNIQLTCDPDTPVRAVAEAIARRDPSGAHARVIGHLSLALASGGSTTTLAPSVGISESGIRNGSTIAVVTSTSDVAEAKGPVAVLKVVSAGPDSGKEYPLSRGSSWLGRGSQCQVQLRDPLVSNVHARIHVGDVIEIVDQNSSNGIEVAGQLVARTTVKSDDVLVVGDTAFTIAMRQAEATVPGGPEVLFNRPPRLAPKYDGTTLMAPEPPAPPQSRRMPIIPLIVPLLMGGVLFLITKNAASIAFVALSPIIMLGSAVESSIGGKRDFKRHTKEFLAAVEDLRTRIGEAAVHEREIRVAAQPPTSDYIAALRTMSPLLWSRRPDVDTYLKVRLGLGTQDSQISITMPSARAGDPELWGELDKAVTLAATVDDVPVVADLRDVGGLGLAGSGPRAMDVARAVVLQILLAHSPADVVLTGIGSGASTANWDWLTWVPHVAAAEPVVGVAPLAITMPAGVALAAAIEELIKTRQDTHAGAQDVDLPSVLLLVANDNPVPRPTLVQIAEHGPAVGVHVIWVAPTVAALPAACRAYVDIPAAGSSDQAGFVNSGQSIEPLATESVDRATITDLAHLLAPVVDSAAPGQDQAGLPSTVSYLSLAGLDIAESADAVIERWTEGGSLQSASAAPGHRRREGTLRALVGSTDTEQTYLDLRLNGPHALVGGTTGSGKSEFLQTWVVGMAAAHSPQRVTFLLVDYKGGSAFADCVRLPHTVGLVTDLSPHLVRRALVSLNAELRHREHVLNSKRAKDLIELERTGDPETPPSLVVVVDEFAALVQEVPEFVDGVVNIAQRGRSLGIHLILATQRPAGVIKDNLRANTNLRVALRMADEADSLDVVGEKIAAGFDPSIPGRAVVKTGPARLSTFQAAYVGGWTSREPQAPRITIEDLTFGPRVRWAEPEDASAANPTPLGDNDIQRIVDTISQASVSAALAAPRKPWLPELAEVYDLAVLPTRRTDTELVYGVADDPENQSQPVAAFHPDRDGSMIVYGTGGSGKSTFLRAIAVAAGLTARGGPCQVYGLDFGARGLASLEVLPHVGSIVAGDDDERVARLVRTLRELIDARAQEYSAVNAGTITEYRQRAAKPDEPRILLLIDGVGAFRQAYEVGQRSRWFDVVQSIAVDGRPVGVHLVVSADRPGAVPSTMASALQRRLVLRLASESDESMLGIRGGVLHDAPPGRGLLDGQETQVGILGRDASAPGQAAALAKLAESMRRADVPEAEPVRSLPEQVSLSSLPVAVDGRPTLGLADESLAAVGFPDSGVLVIVGPPASGRTTTLIAMVASMRRFAPDRRLFYIGTRRSPLWNAVPWEATADGPENAAGLAAEITPQLVNEDLASGRAVIVIEGLPSFLNTPADAPLQELMKVARAHGHLVLAEGDTSEMVSSMPLIQTAKSARSGIALQPDQMDGDMIFRTPFPRVTRGEFPPGRGILVMGGRIERVQVELPD